MSDTGTYPASVWVCETGEYEQRYVFGVYTSPEVAVDSIKAEYGPPYRVTWENPRASGPDVVTLTGHFEQVPSWSTRHTAHFDLTRMPLAGGDTETTP